MNREDHIRDARGSGGDRGIKGGINLVRGEKSSSFGGGTREGHQKPHRHGEKPPTVDKGALKSITVAKDKGSAKYCYGCGATIVSKFDQEVQTADVIGGGTNNIGGSQGGKTHKNVSMGLKSSSGGYWNKQKKELEISKIKNWGYCPRCKALQNDAKNNRSPGDSQLEALSPSHEMTQIFRDQVSLIREREDAVVVLCVDAVNPQGSLIRKLRNYVGGNPVLLAVTRCDLLPDYVARNMTPRRKKRIERFFEKQAEDLRPAGVYLCSVDDDEDRDGIGFGFDGARELSGDLLRHLDGRDPFVVGAANIGKSTLTDRLIDNIIEEHASDAMDRYRSQREQRNSKMSEKERSKLRYKPRTDREKNHSRYAAVQQSRVTKSSLPGTTLQNVRVPCFADHTQALWDTPGLLLDPSLSHFPIRNFRRIKAQKPRRIEPQWHDVDRKSFALVVSEYRSSIGDNDGDVDGVDNDEEGENEPLPLLRIEIRLKKKEQLRDPEPVRLVWNSTLNGILATDIVSIEESHSAEKMRLKAAEEAKREGRVHGEQQGSAQTAADLEETDDAEQDEVKIPEGEEELEAAETERTPEERARIKEEKRRQHEKRTNIQIAEMGERKWNLLQKEKKHRRDRLKLQGSGLSLVKEEELPAGEAREVNIQHFGSLGILSPSTDALVRVFAPSTGIQPVSHPLMVVPPQWEDFARDDVDAKRGNKQLDGGDFLSNHREDFGMGLGGMALGEDDDDDGDDDRWGRSSRDRRTNDDGLSHRERYNFRRSSVANEPWAEFSGENIGWKFHGKPLYTKGTFVDGWQEMHEDEKKSSGTF